MMRKRILSLISYRTQSTNSQCNIFSRSRHRFFCHSHQSLHNEWRNKLNTLDKKSFLNYYDVQTQHCKSTRQWLTFKISLAALKVLSGTMDSALASMDIIIALTQRCMKNFHDCNERSATKIFLESWNEAAISINAFSYPESTFCNPWKQSRQIWQLSGSLTIEILISTKTYSCFPLVPQIFAREGKT